MTLMSWQALGTLGAVAVFGGLVLGDDGDAARFSVVLGVAVMVLSAIGYFASLSLGRV